MPRSFTKKANLFSIREAVNGWHNLNNTTRRINQAKKGPFTSWLNQLEPGEVVVTNGKKTIEELFYNPQYQWLREPTLQSKSCRTDEETLD